MKESNLVTLRYFLSQATESLSFNLSFFCLIRPLVMVIGMVVRACKGRVQGLHQAERGVWVVGTSVSVRSLVTAGRVQGIFWDVEPAVSMENQRDVGEPGTTGPSLADQCCRRWDVKCHWVSGFSQSTHPPIQGAIRWYQW